MVRYLRRTENIYLFFFSFLIMMMILLCATQSVLLFFFWLFRCSRSLCFLPFDIFVESIMYVQNIYYSFFPFFSLVENKFLVFSSFLPFTIDLLYFCKIGFYGAILVVCDIKKKNGTQIKFIIDPSSKILIQFFFLIVTYRFLLSSSSRL